MTGKQEENGSFLKPLGENLKQWEEAGIRLYLDGAPTSSECIAQSCVNENAIYMPDYVTDKEGKIKEIRYDRISLE